MKRRTIVIIIIGLISLIGLGLFFNPESSELGEKQAHQEDLPVKVKVIGAVVFPGEYEVNTGMTVAEVIALCGGFLNSASYESLNLAQKVSENQTITVPQTTNVPMRKLSLPIFAKSRAFAFIIGAVNYPGVYAIEPEMTILDLITQSGGLTNDADVGMINLYDQLEDQMMIIIPTKVDDTTPSPGSGKININRATLTELKTLSGIGDAKAQSIIDYRNRNGVFRSTDDLLNVPGIGNEIYNRLKEFITV